VCALHAGANTTTRRRVHAGLISYVSLIMNSRSPATRLCCPYLRDRQGSQLQALVSRHVLRLQSPSYPGKVVITMPDGVSLNKELARERRIGVERHRSGLIELLVG
jgi:hypothetical protein